MPELPEVETIVRRIAPHLKGKRITKVVVREPMLRRKVPKRLAEQITNEKISSISRRGKYILIEVGNGYLLFHFGMSGSLRLFELNTKSESNGHIEFQIEPNWILRFRGFKDQYQRRSGGFLQYSEGSPFSLGNLAKLGPEPLSNDFTGGYLHKVFRNQYLQVKNFIMDQEIVAGIGNIYASEILFDARIHPTTRVSEFSKLRCEILAASIQKILNAAISAGGTTLEDFAFVDPITGRPGSYREELQVYGRNGQSCFRCKNSRIERIYIEFYGKKRVSFYCRQCQK